MSFRLFPLVAVAAGVLGCAGRAALPTLAPNGALAVKNAPGRISAPPRPRVTLSREIDVGSMGVLEAIDPGARHGPEWVRTADGYDLRLPDDMLARMDEGPEILFVGPGQLPADGSAAWREACRRNALVPITWQGFAPKDKTDDAIEFVRYRGDMGRDPCRFSLPHAWRAHAPALVPGALYGFAESAPSPYAVNLVLIGPRAIWMSSSGSNATTEASLHQPFTLLELSVARGSSASAVIDVTSVDLAGFMHPTASAEALRLGRDAMLTDEVPFDRRLTAAVAARARAISLTVDAVWPGDDDRPTVTCFVSFLTAPDAAIVPPPKPTYTFDDDELAQ